MIDQLVIAEQGRQLRNLFHQGVVTGLEGDLLDVSVMTLSGEIEFKGLQVLGRSPGAVKLEEPCFVICPMADPSQAVVVMQLPDPTISQLANEIQTLQQQLQRLQQKVGNYNYSDR